MSGFEDINKDSSDLVQKRYTELPAVVGDSGREGESIYKDYVVRYYKGNLDDIGDKLMLEEIQTKSLLGTEIIMTEAPKMSFFQDMCIVVVRYLEKRKP